MDQRQSGRRATTRTRLLVSAIVVAVLALSLTYLILPGRAPTPTTSQVATSSCDELGGRGFYVRLVADNTLKPIENIKINGTRGYNCWSDGTTTTTTTALVFPFQTNSSGIASLSGANYSSWYDLTFEYSGNTYHIRAEIHPQQTTYVTISLPSGKTAITFK